MLDLESLSSLIRCHEEFLRGPNHPKSLCSPRVVHKKYEKKQISLRQCQDSECMLLKCYLGFGNCGLGGLFGQKERVSEKQSQRHLHEGFCLC